VEAYRLEQEAPLRALQRTSITEDEIPTTVAASTSSVRRKRHVLAWFLLALPVLFVLAAVGGWYLFGH
jgi:eukaryotic-like serine/threonine-protein kinase